jgi:hypothetical protein
MLVGKLFKCLLGKDGLGSEVVNLKVHEMQSGVVVHKNSAVSVPLCEFMVKPFLHSQRKMVANSLTS